MNLPGLVVNLTRLSWVSDPIVHWTAVNSSVVEPWELLEEELMMLRKQIVSCNLSVSVKGMDKLEVVPKLVARDKREEYDL